MSEGFLKSLEEEILTEKFTDATLYLGLATSPINNSDTLEDVAECTGDGYSRQAISFGDTEIDDGVVVVKNTEEIVFGPWEELEPNMITNAFLATVESGTSGLLRFSFEIPTSLQVQPLSSESITIPIGNVVVGVQ